MNITDTIKDNQLFELVGEKLRPFLKQLAITYSVHRDIEVKKGFYIVDLTVEHKKADLPLWTEKYEISPAQVARSTSKLGVYSYIEMHVNALIMKTIAKLIMEIGNHWSVLKSLEGIAYDFEQDIWRIERTEFSPSNDNIHELNHEELETELSLPLDIPSGDTTPIILEDEDN